MEGAPSQVGETESGKLDEVAAAAEPDRSAPPIGTQGSSAPSKIDSRWLLAGAAAAVIIAIVAVVALTSGDGGATAAPATTTTASIASQGVGTTSNPQATTTSPTEPIGAPPSSSDATPTLEVTSVRAFNGDLPEEQSAIQVFLRNSGEVAVNLDRAIFTVVRATAFDCNLLPATGGPELDLFARGFALPPYSVPIFEFVDGAPARVSLNPPRRIPADQEEVLLAFDLDYTLGESEFVTLPDDVSPPYYDEEFVAEGDPYPGMTIFEIEVGVMATTGESFDGQTVVVAHPRLEEGFFTAEGLAATCGFPLDEFTEEAAAQHRAEIVTHCDATVVNGELGANAQFDRLMRDLIDCP